MQRRKKTSQIQCGAGKTGVGGFIASGHARSRSNVMPSRLLRLRSTAPVAPAGRGVVVVVSSASSDDERALTTGDSVAGVDDVAVGVMGVGVGIGAAAAGAGGGFVVDARARLPFAMLSSRGGSLSSRPVAEPRVLERRM